jgi:hypothetical protein
MGGKHISQNTGIGSTKFLYPQALNRQHSAGLCPNRRQPLHRCYDPTIHKVFIGRITELDPWRARVDHMYRILLRIWIPRATADEARPVTSRTASTEGRSGPVEASEVKVELRARACQRNALAEYPPRLATCLELHGNTVLTGSAMKGSS